MPYTAEQPKHSLFGQNPRLKAPRPGLARDAALASMTMLFEVPDAARLTS
ncbi:MAG TPA: hypothetical protein VES20_19120 [Bryobacteraceae bacterium]|nr:hypothetical protein [Bryobacteraceae bacterium]